MDCLRGGHDYPSSPHMQGEERDGVECTLERLLADAACAGGQWEMEEKDPDVLADPIMQLDIRVCYNATVVGIRVCYNATVVGIRVCNTIYC